MGRVDGVGGEDVVVVVVVEVGGDTAGGSSRRGLVVGVVVGVVVVVVLVVLVVVVVVVVRVVLGLGLGLLVLELALVLRKRASYDGARGRRRAAIRVQGSGEMCNRRLLGQFPGFLRVRGCGGGQRRRRVGHDVCVDVNEAGPAVLKRRGCLVQTATAALTLTD
ncbi:hypothetical protein EJ05DRAFT_113224 [Pseudovirgaria hyperparasitica]|uniref:Uncharacterized protein n=1 Tax=Pseudovirgaria hyperparasitica TaxID=470096 RepID=A0A6A6W0Q3_9PEZI|nr:uncharacterized protein EJ05DRAFT_113224 [Pseudovirgaria hyperparasitica]KAF2755719.1 hypothetical protein EJ05DRAFT_113224 [Pseudovirgaria hyperparasitica]